jgi:outer membrane lipoprotein-sorting protein
MKKLLALILCAALLAGMLTGCGSKDQGEKESTKQPDTSSVSDSDQNVSEDSDSNVTAVGE